jgi:hypothetical protein
MADEVTYRAELSFSDGKANPSMASGLKTADLAAASAFQFIKMVDVTTDADGVVIPLGNVATPSRIMAWNNDATNFVEIGHDDSGFIADAKISAGSVALFEPAHAAPYIRSNTSACTVTLLILE